MAITSKSRLFTPSVVRRIISSNAPLTKQTAQDNIGSDSHDDDRDFRLDGPGEGIKSTQQLNVDWSKFENHTFFNSAEAKVNVAFDTIINNFPFDGTSRELEDFFSHLTGYEKHIFETFPKSTGSLNFSNGLALNVTDKSGAMFPSLSKKKGEVVLDPGEASISFETHIFIPSGIPRSPGTGDVDEYNGNQVICQKLDALGTTGFTMGILDSRLKNRLVQLNDTQDDLLWYVPSGNPDDVTTPDIDESYDTLSAVEAGYTGVTVDGMYWSEQQWAAASSYLPVMTEAKIGLAACDLIFLASSGSNHLSASMELPKGIWSHICATYDRGPGKNNLKLYLDGKLKMTTSNSYNMATFSTAIDESGLHPAISPFSFRVSDLTIGGGASHFHGSWPEINEVDWGSVDASHDGIPDDRYTSGDDVYTPSFNITQRNDNSPPSPLRDCFTPTSFFSGSLDNFRIWHSTRTEDVLKSISGKDVYSDTPGSLKLSYKFNEPDGEFESRDLVLDSSGNALHTRISNHYVGCRDPYANLNLIDTSAGDPDDPCLPNIKLEKLSLNPILFPSHPDVASLNKALIDVASWYDTNNPNLITNLVPKHYFAEAQSEFGLAELHDEAEAIAYDTGKDIPGGAKISSPQIMQSLLFTWARYFDEMKMFLDHFGNLMNIDYDTTETIPENFLPFLSNYYGIDLPKTFTDASLSQFLEGENISPDQGISELSLQFVQNQIWRRVLVNINEILQSKGTVHGIRTLLLSMGISPDKLFRFREYGGSRNKTLNDVRKFRVEVSSMLDFSGTLAGPNEHRPAPGFGNPFSYVHKPLVSPWTATSVDDLTSLPIPLPNDYKKSPFITPFIMSPFLSGSRVEVGPCLPDSDIPIATATLTIDYSLPPDASYATIPPRYRQAAGYLADSTILEQKIVKLKDIDSNIFMLQFRHSDDSEMLDGVIEVDLRSIEDRIDIAQKIVDVINSSTTLLAYNISEQNDGIIKILQPRGGRTGNYPLELLQVQGNSAVSWNGLIQAVDSFGNKLWKRPDNGIGIVQATNTDAGNIYTPGPDYGDTFTEDPGDEPVYQLPLSAVGYESNPQSMVWNKEHTAEIGVWKHTTTGKFTTYEDHVDYGDPSAPSGGVFSDADMAAPYEKVLIEQTEEAYALKHGYTPVYNRKPYLTYAGFESGLYGIIDKAHPDLTPEESLFIKENGSYHGFNQTRTDGLFTSGSWTVEAIYKFDKPKLTFYPVTQSLMRLQSTVGPPAAEQHVVLSNLLCMREPEFEQETGEEIIKPDGTVKLYVRPEMNTGTDPSTGLAAAKELVLEVTGVNIFDGQKWNISYGRDRADQINSAVSSSYFLRVSKNQRGEIKTFKEDRRMFLETMHVDKRTFWSDVNTGKNDWGSFIVVGSQSLPDAASVANLGLNTSLPEEKVVTDFSGEIAQLRFWSRGLSVQETKEHTRNPMSIGVKDPSTNFNFVTSPEGSWEKLRMDVSFDQPVTASIEDEAADQAFRDASMTPLGWIELFDFSQAVVTGSRGALWNDASHTGETKFHLYGYGFEAEIPNIKPERFDYQTIDAKFDEQSVDNKVRVRGFQQTENIEEFQTDVAPVYEILASETPSDDTRFSIDISSVQALNDDIVKIFSTLELLDNVIGAPELVFTQSYPDLEFLRQVYFNRLEGKVRVKSFFEFFKWFDNAVGDLIKTLLPRKTHFLGVNFVVESHMLERAKMTYNYSDVYLGAKNRHGLKGTMTLQQYVGQIKRF